MNVPSASPARYGDDYGAIYRVDYDATYGSARQLGISGVLPQREYDADEEDEREGRQRAHDRLVRAEEERRAVDAVTEEASLTRKSRC
jgi:hypothetical protein